MLSFILMVFLYLIMFMIAVGVFGMVATSIEKNGIANTLGNIVANSFILGMALAGIYFIIERVLT